MTRCPICEGTGFILSEKHPQNKQKERLCVCCLGTGETEVIPTSKQRITIIKPHGVYCETMTE